MVVVDAVVGAVVGAVEGAVEEAVEEAVEAVVEAVEAVVEAVEAVVKVVSAGMECCADMSSRQMIDIEHWRRLQSGCLTEYAGASVGVQAYHCKCVA